MKKLMTMLSAMLFAVVLVGCGMEYPEGVSEEFYHNADEMFNEIDEDTQEMEISDKDDLRNLMLLERKAGTDNERAIAEAIAEMAKTQAKVLQDDAEALDDYLEARSVYAGLMEQSLYEFEFTEED
jgi:citrate lyase gamma subunit